MATMLFSQNDPEGIRTPDPRLRRPLLYPAELLNRKRIMCDSFIVANFNLFVKNFLVKRIVKMQIIQSILNIAEFRSKIPLLIQIKHGITLPSVILPRKTDGSGINTQYAVHRTLTRLMRMPEKSHTAISVLCLVCQSL